MRSALITAAAACLGLLVVSEILAQEVVTSYTDAAGSIVRRNIADGSIVSRSQRVYQSGGVTFLPTRIAYDSSFYYAIFGERYLAKLRLSDAAIVWVVDASVFLSPVRYLVHDLAVGGGNVFVCTKDPAGRITKYRGSDGAALWTIQAGVMTGNIGATPVRLATTGTDALYAALGAMFLTRLRQSDGGVVWRKDISLTYSLATWGVADMTAGSGFVYVANVDPNGSLRKFSAADGSLVWTKTPFFQIGATKYQPRLLAAAGTDAVMVLFASRYLGRLRATDATSVWTVDTGITSGVTTFVPSDVAAAPSP